MIPEEDFGKKSKRRVKFVLKYTMAVKTAIIVILQLRMTEL